MSFSTGCVSVVCCAGRTGVVSCEMCAMPGNCKPGACTCCVSVVVTAVRHVSGVVNTMSCVSGAAAAAVMCLSDVTTVSCVSEAAATAAVRCVSGADSVE